MFVKQHAENIESPPRRSKWKMRQVGIFICDFCGDKFETRKNIKRKKATLNFCDKICSNKARKANEVLARQRTETTVRLYGVKHFSQRPDVREKRKRTFYKKYGVENPSQMEVVKRKKEKTCLGNYGVPSPMMSRQIQQKKKKTCLKKYGFEHATQSPEIKRKAEITCKQKYGVRNYALSDEFIQRFDKGEFHNNHTENGYFAFLGEEHYYRSSYELAVLTQVKVLESSIAAFQTNFVIPYIFEGKPTNILLTFLSKLIMEKRLS